MRLIAYCSTRSWRCAVCLHDNSGVGRYCVMCKSTIQEDRHTVSASMDMAASNMENGFDTTVYTLVESPRPGGDAMTVADSCTRDQRVAMERLEWKRCLSKNGAMQWVRTSSSLLPQLDSRCSYAFAFCRCGSARPKCVKMLGCEEPSWGKIPSQTE
jgi:hypothetical protein